MRSLHPLFPSRVCLLKDTPFLLPGYHPDFLHPSPPGALAVWVDPHDYRLVMVCGYCAVCL